MSTNMFREHGFGPDVELNSPAFIHPTAQIYGMVTISPGSSMWPNSVIRAEMNRVVLGKLSNIQDMAMVHIGFDNDTIIGDYCTITHHCILHGCTIEPRCLIGINATIMDGCVIGAGSIVAGGAFLKQGTIIPPHSIVMGAPAKVVKERDCRAQNQVSALIYHRNAMAYAQGFHRTWSASDFQEFRQKELERARQELEID